jgi:hypothetical protein
MKHIRQTTICNSQKSCKPKTFQKSIAAGSLTRHYLMVLGVDGMVEKPPKRTAPRIFARPLRQGASASDYRREPWQRSLSALRPKLFRTAYVAAVAVVMSNGYG